jgi:hypothetical protein
MVSDDTNLVWSSADVALKTCQKSQCVQQSLVSTGLTQANAVALYAGVAYVADLGGANPGTGSISSCPLSSTSCVAGNFVSGITRPGALAVDGSGVYWSSPEPGDGAAPTYGLYTCPLAGCPASGPRELVANQPGGMGIVTTYANLVYFTIGNNGYSIMAVAKP